MSAIWLKPTLPTKPTTTCKRQQWQPKLSALGQAENKVTYSYNRTHRSHTGWVTVLTDCALLPQERPMLIKVKKIWWKADLFDSNSNCQMYINIVTYSVTTLYSYCILRHWRHDTAKTSTSLRWVRLMGALVIATPFSSVKPDWLSQPDAAHLCQNGVI